MPRPKLSESPRQVLWALGFAGLGVSRRVSGAPLVRRAEPPGEYGAQRRRRQLGRLGLGAGSGAVTRVPEVDVQVLDLVDQQQDRLRSRAQLAPLVPQQPL